MKKKKTRRQKVIPVLPNILTSGSLFVGLCSIMTSIGIVAMEDYGDFTSELIHRKFWLASSLIVVASVLDMLDGKLARALKSQSSFGLSFDSLSDLVSFGVAPGVLMYVWALMGAGKLGLMAVLFYIVCTALRLARFNIQSGDLEKYNFTGLPSPIAAGLIFSPILLFSEFRLLPDEGMVWFYLVSAPVVGLLMVSNIPYWKYPRIKLSGPFNALVIASIIIAAMVTNPGIMVIAVVYLYCLAGLILYILRQLSRKSKLSEDFHSQQKL